MIRKFRSSILFRMLSLTTAFVILSQIFLPTVAWALTGGPSQPEVQSFEPVGTTEMVDLFTGDFTYNIPLLDVGGYPVNMSYNAGISMDQEASWVGLGWNINPGAITRNMRGIPDDFNGTEKITKELNMNPNWTVGFSTGVGFEIVGLDFIQLGFSLGVKYNNYVGVGFEQGMNIGLTAGKNSKSGNSASLGLSLNSSASDGFTISPSLSYSKKVSNNYKGSSTLGLSVGTSVNTRAGLGQLTINKSISSHTETEDGVDADGNAVSYRVDKTGGTVSNGSSISFASPTYTPGAEMSFLTNAISGKVSVGGTGWTADISFDISAYYSRQELLEKEIENNAYGYLYSHEGQNDKHGVHDYNREKDQPYMQDATTNLPVTNFSYDTYSVAGQGVGGQYRPYRSDFGHVYDARAISISNSGSFGVEIDAGNTFHAGGSFSLTHTAAETGKWKDFNAAEGNLRFAGGNGGDPTYEPAYFRQVGELSVEPIGETFRAELQDKDVIDIELAEPAPFVLKAKDRFRKGVQGNTTVAIPPGGIARDSRVKRNQVFSYLTLAEAKQFGLQTELYDIDDTYAKDEAEDHHIAEVTILRPDGSRYVYGLPAYNTEQKEVTFSVAGTPGNVLTGLVDYNAGVDNTSSNTNGKDHFFSATKTPGFAHSYMLTAIVSPDYVDRTGNGPTMDDFGSYTVFRYNLESDGDQGAPVKYDWRTPYDKASYNEGLKTLEGDDDKGSYIYGVKELWYLSKIETRTQIAEFELSSRKDGRGVSGENGGIGAATKQLDVIHLYSRPDYEVNGSSANKIKSVHFEYDQFLCNGVQNYSGTADANGKMGKLTLRKVWFTYGNSFKGRFSPYKFSYEGSNPPYDITGYDRWGNYKPPVTSSSMPTNAEFPYVNQSDAGIYADAWCLTNIKLPSGGEIEVNYDADDYAYVQDKRAGQMVKVKGFMNCSIDPNDPPSGSVQSALYDNSGPNLYLIFDPEATLTNDQQVKDEYFNEDIYDNLYFRCSVKLANTGLQPDFVSGYAQIARDGSGEPIVGRLSGTNYGYIKLKGVKINGEGACNGCDDGCANPISRAAWQFGRMHAPRQMYGLPSYSDAGNISDLASEMIGSSWFSTIPELWNGPHGTFKNNNYGKLVDPNRSWIRLQNPDRNRKGGGHRVASIKLYDHWNEMVTEGNEATYGQIYTYNLVDDPSTSSGVAAWEPILGGDENPHHLPVAFSQEHLLAPDDNHYLEEPFGESFFPSPRVGYSQVTVRNIAPGSGIEVTHHGSGKVVHEFYTAKDYPTITKRTQIQPLRHRTYPFFQLFSFLSLDFVAASQGYLVELNDMHGKPKSVANYAEEETQPFAKVEYFYKEQSPGLLDNEVTVLDKYEGSGNIVRQAEVGVEIDAIADFRQSWTHTISGGAAFNAAGFLAGIIPGVLPTVWPSFNLEEVLFRSAVVTKVVNRFGILERTVATENGSMVETKNLAFDSETGEVLLTQTINDYNDSIFSFTYPAHWGYDRMGSAYKNLGIALDLVSPQLPGSVDDDFENSNGFLVVGDELAVVEYDGAISKKWVWDDDQDPSSVYLINEYGALYSSTDEQSCKVIRSGRRNMQTLPIGKVVTKKNPIQSGKLVFESGNPVDNEMGRLVLNAESMEYAEEWHAECTECIEDDGCKGLTFGIGLDGCNLVASSGGDGYTWTYGGDTVQTGTSNVYLFNPGCEEPSPGTPRSLMFDPPDYCVTVTLGGCEETICVECYYDGQCDDLPAEPIAMGADLAGYTFTGLLDLNNGSGAGQVVNPFVRGLRGNWRPLRGYKYLSDRAQGRVNNSTDSYTGDYTTNIRKDGTYVTYDQANPTERVAFKPFWTLPSGPTADWSKDTTYWQWASEVTKVNERGLELENKDALDRYSAALFGYSKTLPTAVGTNAKYVEIAFDGFEDVHVNSIIDNKICLNPHFPLVGILSSKEAHSGYHSVVVLANGSLDASVQLTHDTCDDGIDDAPYTLKECDCVGRFSPETHLGDRKYVASVWVKQKNDLSQYVIDYSEVDLVISSTLITDPIETYRSPIIDGWQQITKVFVIDGTITVPSEAVTLNFDFEAGSDQTWFDDIRIHPFNSSLKSFVYDPVSLRLMAELDENNYATFYEYDEEGRLTRVKKETERGIVTIQESRTATAKTVQ